MVETNVERSRGGRPERKMSDLKCWPEVEVKIRAGEQTGKIAQWIQEHGEYTDIQRDSLRRMVARERERMAVGASLPEQRSAEKKLKDLREVIENTKETDLPDDKKKRRMLDVLEEISRLYELQMERIEAGRTIEKSMKYLLNRMTADIAEAREILKFAFEVQSDPTMRGREKGIEAPTAKQMGSLGFEARKRVLQALEMVKDKLKVMELEDKRLKKATEEVVVDVVAEPVGEPKPEDLPFK